MRHGNAPKIDEARKLEAVREFRRLCQIDPDMKRRFLFERVAERFQVSVRSLQKWVSRYERNGEEGVTGVCRSDRLGGLDCDSKVAGSVRPGAGAN